MRRLHVLIPVGLLILLSACVRTQIIAPGPAAAAATPGFDAAGLRAFREQRLAALRSDTGWLTPVALYWLKEGDNSFGRDAGNDFALDSPALAPHAGNFHLQRGSVDFQALPDSGISLDGRPVHRVELRPDTRGAPTELRVASLRLGLIERAGRLGIRARDSVSPQRAGFTGLRYFPDRADWSVDARFEPYAPARQVTIVNILGMEISMSSPGAIVFEHGGRAWRLDTLLEEPGDQRLFVMFADDTSGRETYGAGRFLYIPLPRDGHVRVDFNRAHNPPCAFTAFATCPLPPPQNHLKLRIDAGELKYEHAAAGGAH